MHPLELLNEAELGSLARVVDRLLNTRHLLAPGQRTNRLRPGFGVEFLDHREYSPGDDIRAVDWRSSARSRHPQIRRYSDEAASDWCILLDCSSSMAFGRNRKWSLAVQCAAAMAYRLVGRPTYGMFWGLRDPFFNFYLGYFLIGWVTARHLYQVQSLFERAARFLWVPLLAGAVTYVGAHVQAMSNHDLLGPRSRILLGA